VQRERVDRTAGVDGVEQSRRAAGGPAVALHEVATQRADVPHGLVGGLVGDEAVGEGQRVGGVADAMLLGGRAPRGRGVT
jgi:hypothetical protein